MILRSLSNLEAQGGDEFFGELELVVADLLRTGQVSLPEAGDLDAPKLVFVLDEAHLLVSDASKAFLRQIEQTVTLIRSKGVGVFFCTQLPTDIPNAVLSQLGADPARSAGVHAPMIRRRWRRQ